MSVPSIVLLRVKPALLAFYFSALRLFASRKRLASRDQKQQPTFGKALLFFGEGKQQGSIKITFCMAQNGMPSLVHLSLGKTVFSPIRRENAPVEP